MYASAHNSVIHKNSGNLFHNQTEAYLECANEVPMDPQKLKLFVNENLYVLEEKSVKWQKWPTIVTNYGRLKGVAQA